MPARSLDPRASPFFRTAKDRAALARERFFGEGQRPSGLVSESVIQSWSRCLGAHRDPEERIEFDPVSKIRIATTLTKNRLLLEAANDSMVELEMTVAGSPVRAMLTNRDGVVIRASRGTLQKDDLLHVVSRIGVSIGEVAVGTGAPGVAVRTGDVSVIQGGEHFFRCMETFHCSGAPIRDSTGNIVAVLNLSSELPFQFDVKAVAQMYATSIENSLLASSARSQVLVRFQASPDMFHTPLEGLSAIDFDGRVLWFNGAGASLMGSNRVPETGPEAGEVFGLDVESLLDMAHQGRPRTRLMPSGLTLWMEAQFEGRSACVPAPAIGPVARSVEEPTASESVSLKDVQRSAIEKTFAQCRGNVSKTARTLGVSRGLLYRRLKEWRLT